MGLVCYTSDMTKVTLYNAITIDGYIAGLDGDSHWAEDSAQFEAVAKEYGCIVLGRITFEQFERELYPIDGVQHIVLTSGAKGKVPVYHVVHYADSVTTALAQAEGLGYERVLLVGGSKTNESFAAAGMISEIILNVHPLALGEGKPLLGGYRSALKLGLTNTSELLPGIVQNRYEVMK